MADPLSALLVVLPLAVLSLAGIRAYVRTRRAAFLVIVLAFVLGPWLAGLGFVALDGVMADASVGRHGEFRLATRYAPLAVITFAGWRLAGVRTR